MICALLGLLPSPALAAEDRDATVSAEDAALYQSHLDQARFFAKRRWYADALVEIDAALATTAGETSFEARWLGAQVAWELTDGLTALRFAEEAAARAERQDDVDMALAFADGLRRDIGTLTVNAPYPGVVSRLQLEPLSPMIDPSLKEFSTRAALRWRDKTPLPATLSLPAGDWLVNGVSATVRADEEETLVLPMRNVGNRALSALQVSRLELSTGVAIWVGDDVHGLYPAARGQLSWTQPAGPLLLGLVGELDLQGYSTADHQSQMRPLGGGVGLRVGTEIFVGGPIGIRPSLTARYARLPGIEADCLPDGQAWVCGWESPTEGPVNHLYVASPAWLAGGELLIEHREAGRTTSLGTGVKLGVEHAFGHVPASGEALTVSGQAVPWTSDQGRFGGDSISMLANLALAF